MFEHQGAEPPFHLNGVLWPPNDLGNSATRTAKLKVPQLLQVNCGSNKQHFPLSDMPPKQATESHARMSQSKSGGGGQWVDQAHFVPALVGTLDIALSWALFPEGEGGATSPMFLPFRLQREQCLFWI